MCKSNHIIRKIIIPAFLLTHTIYNSLRPFLVSTVFLFSMHFSLLILYKYLLLEEIYVKADILRTITNIMKAYDLIKILPNNEACLRFLFYERIQILRYINSLLDSCL